MTGKKKKKVRRWVRRRPKQDDQGGSGGSAKMRWAQYLHQVKVKVKARGGVELVQQVSELRVHGPANLTPGMMKCISQLPKLHAIEIIHCHVEDVPPLLSECDSLVILRMSNNRLRKFSEDFAKCARLEQIIVDWNEISEISAGIFGSRNFCFSHLEVVNLSHNALSSLPPDFGITSKGSMRQIDLSNNSIQSIPDSVTTCKNLEELDLSHNRLKQLPRQFKKLTRLQKLFVSFNELTCLPEDIGECMALSKIRIISNQVKELPDSIIELWPKKPGGKGGKLEQFLVERNPLVHPSITAFEMDNGGIDRAFELLYEHIKERDVQKLLALEAKALEADAARHAMIEDPRQRTISSDSMLQDLLPAIPEERGDGAGAPGGVDYYFAHCRGTVSKIQEIRDAESTLLLLKQAAFVHEQQELAKEIEHDDGIDKVPLSLQPFLDGNSLEDFKGIVPVRDLDIYFNLLVFSTKPQFPTCQQLFLKYEDGDKGYLDREEWNEFCLCVPIYIDDGIRDSMWQFMAFRRSDRVSLTDFVAAWHIHDIEAQDPLIQSTAKMLRLDYYDMSVKELRDRVFSKGARDASPQLDFDNPEEQGALHTQAPSLQDNEGIRALDQRLKEAAYRQDQTRTQLSKEVGTKRGTGTKASLTESQYMSQAHAARETTDDKKSEASDDEDLSAGSLTEESEFDGRVALSRHERSKQHSMDVRKPQGPIIIDSDEAIRRLMELPVEEFFKPARQAAAVDDAGGALGKATNARAEQEEDKKGPGGHESIVKLRRLLRQVYRNMPHHDFVALISFLLRAMQTIKHQDGNVYWHVDDPTFKHMLGQKGTNGYTVRLLINLGFTKLTEVHWVWPISKELDKSRLDEMMVLLKSCQMSLHKMGSSFTGHFSLPH